MKQFQPVWKVQIFLWAIFSCLLFSPKLHAQNELRKITGKITTKDGHPLPGISVVLKGSNQGTSTGSLGEFIISARSGDILVLSSVGYQPKEIKVGNTDLIEVNMEQDQSNLNEVVVIGYGSVKRKDVTGAISSISAKDIANTVSTTFDQALQGKVAGVVVNQNSGQPGGGVSVQIRGVGSINSSIDPLYVIDGVIIQPNQTSSTGGVYIGNNATNDNPLSTINPADIESIDVLKDASAIAIYGSQGSNGVIVITTKRGRIGVPKVSLDGYYGIQQLPRYLPMMNLPQYATFINEKDSIIGATPPANFANPKYLGPGTDWQRAIFSSAPMYSGSISVSGGDPRTQYLFSGNYFSQDGIAAGSNFKRGSGKINLDNKTTDWLKIGTSLTFTGISEEINTTNQDLLNAAFNLTPDIPVSNPDGSIGGPTGYNGASYNPNPVAAARLNTNQVKRSQVYGNVYSEIYFAKFLTLRSEVSGSFDYGNINQFFPTYTINGVANTLNSANVIATNNKSWTTRNYLTYNKLFKDIFNVNIVAGHEASYGIYTYLSGFRSGFLANNPTDLDLGNTTTATNGGGSSDYSNESYFGRANFSLTGNKFLTGTIRRDGNSNFAPQNRWNTTYSFGGAWDLATESFLKNQTFIDQLKIRVGYGLTNNANIGGYKYGVPLSQGPVGLGTGYHVTQIAAPDITWETTKSTNLGMDIGVFKSRIQLTIDAYDRTTNKLLLQLPLPDFSGTTGTGGVSSPYGNVGSIQNKGLEFTLTTHNIQSKDLTWTSNITFSMNRNKILSLNTPGAAFYGIIDNGGVTVTKTAVGRSLGEFYGWVANGIYKNAADLNNSPKPASLTIDRTTGVWVGDVKFKDLSGPTGKPDGVIDENDETYLGSPLPKFQFGFNNTFNYKGFDLTIFFTGNYGNKILNYELVKHENPNSGATGYFEGLNNFARVGLINPTGSVNDVNNVQVTNPKTTLPGIRVSGDPAQDFRISSLLIENGSYVRLKNLVLGYNIPAKWITKYHSTGVRVYINVQNVFTITKYTGYDPEVGYNLGSSGGTPSLTGGIDYGRYPTPRIFTFGFNVGLQ